MSKWTPEEKAQLRRQVEREIAMQENRTKGTNQQVPDIAVLLQRLASVCITLLGIELVGASYKHGLNPINGEWKEHRASVAGVAVELLQEACMSREELLQIWDEQEAERKEQ
jgi:hypothetical protein